MPEDKENPAGGSPYLQRRILIADDQRNRFAEITQVLNENNFDVTHCVDRKKCLETAIQYQPDLIIINLLYGGGGAVPLIRELKTHLSRQGTKILVLTKHKNKENIVECIKAGASDFVAEPFEPRFLLQRIRYQLQEREYYSPNDLQAEPTQVLAGFQLVYECLRIMAEVKDTHRAIYECLKRISDISRSTRVNIILADLETDEGTVIATSDDETMNDKAVDLERYPEVREVLMNGSIVFVKDITSNPLTNKIKDRVRDIEIDSLLVFPVRHRGETIGTLSVRLNKEGLDVSDKHLKTFYMLAIAMGAKVAARRLLKKLKKNDQAQS